MGLIDELINFITQGSIQGLPPIVLMIIPFVLGLIVGYFIKRLLKIAIIALIIIAILTYFGFFNLTFGSLTGMITTYGPIVAHYAVLLLGLLPLSIGFVIGLILGFIFG